MQPTFLVLEGPDGGGTTRHTALLAERLQREGYDVLATAEPTDGPIGLEIRKHLSLGDLGPDALQLLFTADRADHLRRGVVPALQSGRIVVSDRYVHSTLAYGECLGLPSSWLYEMNKNFVQPSCVIFALPPRETCIARLAKRDSRDAMEGEDLQEKVYAWYERHAREHGIPVLDTSGTKEDVHETLWNMVTPFLPTR